MKRSGKIALQLGFWLSYLILVMVILGVLYGREENVDNERLERAFTIILFIALIPSAISFYSFYYFIFPKFFQKKKFVQTFAYGTIISIGAASIGFAILSEVFNDGSCTEESSNAELGGFILFMALITEISGVIALLMKGFITWFEELKLREALTQKNHETELALVKSQLDPHFLFNTINNIDVLILKDAEMASEYLNKLSDIMRFMLYETKSDEIPLWREMEYIQKYIELQKIRTANQNYIQLEVEGDSREKTIAPMLFIPFIENAVKHTHNKKLNNAIQIHIGINGKSTSFSCVNKFDIHRNGQNRNPKNGGLGNDLIQKRLNLLYPEQHQLKVEKLDDTYSVELTIENG